MATDPRPIPPKTPPPMTSNTSTSAGSKPATGGGTVGPGFAKQMGGVINQPVGYGDSFPSFPSEPLTRDDVKALAGDLAFGELGYVELDEEGKPVGPAKRDYPEPGKPIARVVGFGPRHYDEVVTPAGAPLTRQMNPNPDLWDDGMRARNPVPVEETRAADERLEKIREANRKAMEDTRTSAKK